MLFAVVLLGLCGHFFAPYGPLRMFTAGFDDSADGAKAWGRSGNGIITAFAHDGRFSTPFRSIFSLWFLYSLVQILVH